MKKVRVLITDDSNLMRKLLSNIISKDTRLEVVGTAENGSDCIDKVNELQPDVVTLDMNMPVMDGLTCLREAQARNLKPAFLVVSSLAQKDAQITIDAINAGALDYIPKPSQVLGISALEKEIASKIIMVHEARTEAMKSQQATAAPAVGPPSSGPKLAPGPRMAQTEKATTGASNPASAAVAERRAGPAASRTGSKPKLTIFGGSSGSMRVVQKLVPEIEADFSGVIVFVLHLPAFFTSQLVQALQKVSRIPVLEAQHNVPVALKKIYVAPGGDKNIILARNAAGKGVVFQLIDNDQMVSATPSIDVFMTSAAGIFKDACRGIAISGTGTDGIEGLRAIRENRGECYAQDKASAVASQLPMAAWNAGVVSAMVDTQGLIDLLKK